MKIEFSTEDFLSILSELNNKSFLQVSNMEKSNEKWGLPNFQDLVFDTENEAWKSDIFKNAIAKVKEYAKKKGYKIATAEEMKQGAPVLLSKLGKPDEIAKGLMAKSERPKIINYNGVTLLTSTLSFEQRKEKAGEIGQMVGGLAYLPTAGAVGGMTGVAAKGLYALGAKSAALGTIAGGIGQVVIGSVLSQLIGHFTAKGLLYLSSATKGKGIKYSFVGFIRPKDKKIIYQKFAFFYIGDVEDIKKAKGKSQESLNYLQSIEEEDIILGEGIGDAAEKTTVEGDVPDPKAPETPTNDEPEVVDVGGEMDPCNKEDGDYTCQIDDENAPMTPAEAEAAFESLLDPDYIDDSAYPFMV